MTPALVALAYLLGATPTSYWVGRLFHGKDLRREGSGNLGATNVFRVLGWRWAVPVMLVDVAKGYVPVAVFPVVAGVGAAAVDAVGVEAGGSADTGFAWTLAFGAAAIAGHVFSFWVGFKGGKGVATGAGVFLALAPGAVLGAFIVWCALTLSTGIVSLGSIGAAVVLAPLVGLTPHQGGTALTIFAGALSLFVIWAHRANLRRLLRGTEHGFRARRTARKGAPASTGGEPTEPLDR